MHLEQRSCPNAFLSEIVIKNQFPLKSLQAFSENSTLRANWNAQLFFFGFTLNIPDNKTQNAKRELEKKK